MSVKLDEINFDKKLIFLLCFSCAIRVHQNHLGYLKERQFFVFPLGKDGFHYCERFFKRHSCLYLAILGTFASRTTDDYRLRGFFTSSLSIICDFVWFFLCYTITSRDLRAISIIATIHPEGRENTNVSIICSLIKETLIKR